MEDKIKEIMKWVDFPNSQYLKVALINLINEATQEKTAEIKVLNAKIKKLETPWIRVEEGLPQKGE